MADKRSTSAADNRPDDSPESYERLAQQAAARLTPGRRKLAQRIRDIEANAPSLPAEVRLYFEAICRAHGYHIARDLFDWTLDVCQPKSVSRLPPIKHKGAHNTARDRLLLAIFDKSNPDSPLSHAMQGRLSFKGEPPRPMTEKQIAEGLTETRKGRERWSVAQYENEKDQGAAHAARTLLRRLKYLRMQERRKSNNAEKRRTK